MKRKWRERTFGDWATDKERDEIAALDREIKRITDEKRLILNKLREKRSKIAHRANERRRRQMAKAVKDEQKEDDAIAEMRKRVRGYRDGYL